MNSSRALRIASMVIIALYTVLLLFPYDGRIWDINTKVLTLFTIPYAAGTLFLAWKRPLLGGLAALFFALLLFIVGSVQAYLIYRENSGAFVLISLFLASPMIVAGSLLLSAHRVMIKSLRDQPAE